MRGTTMTYEEAESKLKKNQKVYRAVYNGATIHVPAYNKVRAASIAFGELGGIVDEAPKPLSAEDIQAYLVGLSEEKKNALLNKLKIMNNGKAGAKLRLPKPSLSRST